MNYRKEEKGLISEIFDEDAYRFENITENGLVIDIGASMGVFSLRCAKERGCTVYAYEPCSHSFKLLSENINLNNMQNKIKAFKIAIGARNEVRKFYYNPNHPGNSSLYPHEAICEEELVNCNTIKSIYEDNNVLHCDALKIDCEEAEREIFTEESKLFFKCTDYVALEWHSYDGHIYGDYLEKLGFSILLTGCGDPSPPYDITFGRGMLYGWRI